ncbi:MAG: hypothetical protein ABSH33_08690 [Steroidobacteraceae bacterium]|jgi:hypothetical protein
MLKTIATICGALAIGPVLAVLTSVAGCFGQHPLFGDMCGNNEPITLLLCVVFWFAVVALAVFLGRRRLANQAISAPGIRPSRRVKSPGDSSRR